MRAFLGGTAACVQVVPTWRQEWKGPRKRVTGTLLTGSGPLPRAGPRGDLGGGVSGPSMGVQGRGALLSARIVPGGAVGVSVG